MPGGLAYVQLWRLVVSLPPPLLGHPALQAKECMLFAGTGIASGVCLGVVNSIGMATEIGQIQAQIQVQRGRGAGA